MIIGFACGVFDLFHAGHVLMLEECKNHCDFLIVALNKAENFDPEINPEKKAPINSYYERKLILKSCRFVDEVIGYSSEDELLEILKTKSINIRFLGDDYKNKFITGNDLAIPIYYTDRSHGYSTSALIKKIILRYPLK